MSPSIAKDTRLVLGGSPRVHLLPPEVADRKRGHSIRRAVVISVIGAVVVCGAAYAGSSWLAIEAAAKYDAALAETTTLLTEKGQYTELTTLSGLEQTLTSARQAGAVAEVDWEALYKRVLPTLPAGVTIESFVIDSITPVEEPVVQSIPGLSSGAAKITFVANTADLASAQAWVQALKSLPEYGGSAISSITRDETGKITVTVDLTITSAALSLRFQPEPVAIPTTDESTDTAAAKETN